MLRASKWISLCLCLFVAVIWWLSKTLTFGWEGAHTILGCVDGTFRFFHLTESSAPAFRLNPPAGFFSHWDITENLGITILHVGPFNPAEYAFELRLWIAFAILTTLTWVLWWLAWRNRPRPGCCEHCGYDLTANTSGVCPECGTVLTPPDLSRVETTQPADYR